MFNYTGTIDPGAQRMRRMLSRLILLCLPMAAAAIEEPGFAVLERHEAFELRRYEPFVVAETVVEADFEGAGNRGFRVLADYIFGNNAARDEIDMTAPVTQRASVEIDMTAPVLQREGAGERHVIGFVMPEPYTLATLPAPMTDAIAFREVPERLVAARRYSGRWNEARFREQETALRDALAEHGLEAVAPPEYARYDPPFMPWFMRRNEVLIEVRRIDR